MFAFRKRFGTRLGGVGIIGRIPALPRTHSIHAAPVLGETQADREDCRRSYLNEAKKGDFQVEYRKAQAIEIQKSRNW